MGTPRTWDQWSRAGWLTWRWIARQMSEERARNNPVMALPCVECVPRQGFDSCDEYLHKDEDGIVCVIPETWARCPQCDKLTCPCGDGEWWQCN